MIKELGDIGVIIPNADISAFAAGSFTSTNIAIRSSGYAPSKYSDLKTVWFRPGAASAADYERAAGDLAGSTGVQSHLGANYSDTTVGSELVEGYFYGVSPINDWVPACNRCLEYEFDKTIVMISHLSPFDGGMLLSTDTNWTDIGTLTTSAKVATAALTRWGPYSYRLLNNASASAGTRSTGIRIRQGGNVSMYAVSAADTGTNVFTPYDTTNSTAFSGVSPITHSERRPQLMALPNLTVPSTSKVVEAQLTNTSATGDHYWNQVGIYDHDNHKIALPSQITNALQIVKIFQARPKYTTGVGTYDAEAFDPYPLVPGSDYRLIFNNMDAEPAAVWINDTGWYGQGPLYAEVLVSQSSRTTLAATEADTLTVEPHTLYPRTKIELLTSVYNSGIRRHPDFTVQMNKAEEQLKKAQLARPIKSIAPEKTYYTTRSVY